MNFQKKKNLNCLDFGVGDGRHTKFLLKKSNNVLATDISTEAIKLSKKNIPNFKNYLILPKNNYSKLIENKQKFDLIICWETAHWIGDLNKIIDLLNIFTLKLKRKKHIIITFPTEDHYLIKNKKVGKFLYKIKEPERKDALICAPRLKNLKKMFNKNKLQIQQIFKYSHSRVFFDNNYNDLSSTNLKNKMFSMYAFLLQKK